MIKKFLGAIITPAMLVTVCLLVSCTSSNPTVQTIVQDPEPPPPPSKSKVPIIVQYFEPPTKPTVQTALLKPKLPIIPKPVFSCDLNNEYWTDKLSLKNNVSSAKQFFEKIKEEVNWWDSWELLKTMTNALSAEGFKISLSCDLGEVNQRSFNDLTPLYFIVKFHKQPENIVQILLDSGASSEPDHKWLETPLMYAAENADGGIKAAQLLLNAGSDINAQDLSNQTPIFYAARQNTSADMIYFLFEQGADIESIAKGGITPLMKAAEYNSNLTVIQALINVGADVNATDEYGTTAEKYSKKNLANPNIYKFFLALSGHPQAQNWIGYLYEHGNTVIRDYNEAIKWYTRAAEQNYPESQSAIGRMYHNGQGVTQDYEKAIKWYIRAAEQGNVVAQTNLAILYVEESSPARDYKSALKWFTEAATQGNAQAQTNLGIMYSKGLGVTKDDQKAVGWYTRSAKQGNSSAQAFLGSSYLLGVGVDENLLIGFMWLSISAEQGNSTAANSLSRYSADLSAYQKEIIKELVILCRESNYDKCSEQSNKKE